MGRKKAGFILLAVLITLSGFSRDKINTEYIIQHYSVEQGLSQSTVYAICQDYLGFMWFGTRGGGLNRFDGHNFTVFQNRLSDNKSISDNEITAIYEDNLRQLWIGTRYGGLNRYVRDDDSFISYTADSLSTRKLTDNLVKVIHRDKSGNLWVGTANGLNLYDSEKDTFTEFLNGKERINDITSLAEDETGNLLVATRNYFLVIKVDSHETKTIPYADDLANVAAGATLFPVVYIDSKNNIWLGTSRGLYILESLTVFRLKESPFGIPLLKSSQIRSILEDKQGNLWIGTPEGLLKLNPQNSRYVHYTVSDDLKNGLSHNSIRSLYEDRAGNIWAGTWGGGTTMISSLPRKFMHVRHYPNMNALSDNIVSSFLDDDNGLWIGTELEGLNYHDYNTGQFKVFLPDKTNPFSISHRHIKCLHRDSRGQMWIGTFGEGVCLYRKDENRFYCFLPGERIYSIHEYPEGTLWIGGISGLYSLDISSPDLQRLKSAESGIVRVMDGFITHIMHDSRGNLWVGSVDNGLHLYNRPGNNFLRFTHDSGDSASIPNNYIISITEDAKNNLWVGTNNGLCRFDFEKRNFAGFEMSDRMPDHVINGLVADDHGGLWISTNKGLSQYNPESGTLRNYDMRDGLQSNEFNRGACYKSRTGEIFFGGINGYNHFHPGELRHNELVPEIVFTAFRLFEKQVRTSDKDSPLQHHISETRHIKLNYRQSVFGFDFVALNYIVPEKNHYRYQLKGYNDNWIDLGNNRSVTFMNLRHGDYILNVMASNNDEVWSNQTASIRLTILPPPWLSKFAYFLYLILIIGLIWFAYSLMVYRIGQKNLLLNQKLENERNEELNQLKLRFFTNISHEFRTPLTLISAPLDTLMDEQTTPEEKRYNYRLIKENILRLKRLVDQLMDFRKAEHEKLKLKVRPLSLIAFVSSLTENFKDLAKRKGIHLKTSFSSEISEIQWFDPDILDKVLFNILSNAFKFTSSGGNVEVSIQADKSHAFIAIKDTGFGIDEDELPHIFDRFYSSEKPDKVYYSGTGIGLAFSKKLIEIHHGQISASSVKGKETVFIVEIPVDRSSYESNEIIEQSIFEPPTGNAEPETEQEGPDYCPDDDSSEHPVMLIAEDNEDLSRYLRNHFHGQFRVLTAKDGAEAFQLAKEHIPDIIISDVIMSNMDGFDLCARIRENVLTSHIPFILLTALTSTESRMAGMERGADAYVDKPFEMKYLESVINNIMHQRSALKEKFLLESRPLADYSGSREELKFLQRIEEIVMRNLANPDFSVTLLCTELNMSRSQLFRKFRAMTGKSPKMFIQVIRLKKAAELMLKEGINVNEVTYEVGFTSPSHFITSFRKYFGKTPKEYVTEIKGLN
jgi:signal transduction histidine kinase/ligand-binding sensor domain-containing protein/DNA-binding response OmpR family regulator